MARYYDKGDVRHNNNNGRGGRSRRILLAPSGEEKCYVGKCAEEAEEKFDVAAARRNKYKNWSGVWFIFASTCAIARELWRVCGACNALWPGALPTDPSRGWRALSRNPAADLWLRIVHLKWASCRRKLIFLHCLGAKDALASFDLHDGSFPRPLSVDGKMPFHYMICALCALCIAAKEHIFRASKSRSKQLP